MKWLEHQLAFPLSLAETTQSRFHSLLQTFDVSTSNQHSVRKSDFVKSDAECSSTHAFVDRADTFLKNSNVHSKETVYKWTTTSCL